MRAFEQEGVTVLGGSRAGLVPRVVADSTVGVGPRYRVRSALELLALQRSAGNRAACELLRPPRTGASPVASTPAPGPAIDATAKPARPVPVVQRGLRKPGKTGGQYITAPTSYNDKKISPTMRAVLTAIIKNNEMHPTTGKHYTMPQALAHAKRIAAQSPRLIVTRPGVRLATAYDLRKYIKGRGGNTSMMKQKLIQHGKAYDSVLNSVAVVQEDFNHLKFTGSPQQVHTQFTQTFSAMMPKLVRTSSAMDEICTDAGQGVTAFGPLKGAWFEHWCGEHLLSGKNRVTFAQRGSMAKQRSSDAYDYATKTLWDMKNYPGVMPAGTSTNQAADYKMIVDKQYKAKNGGATVTHVNYLFPTEGAALANQWLTTTYSFGVYYPQTGPIPKLVKSS